MWRCQYALIKKFRNLYLYPHTWQDDGSKFSWLSKSPTCSGSDSRGWREIWSCSKWTEFVMVSTAGVAAGFEERLRSWKYCKLGTSTFTCILNMVFFICVILGIILSRVSCNVAVVNKSSGATCVISACCWFAAILETGTEYQIRAAVFWTWQCSVIVAKGVSKRLFLSALGLALMS